MKPKFDHLIIRKFDYTDAASTDIRKGIKRKQATLKAEAAAQRIADAEAALKVSKIKAA